MPWRHCLYLGGNTICVVAALFVPWRHDLWLGGNTSCVSPDRNRHGPGHRRGGSAENPVRPWGDAATPHAKGARGAEGG